MPICAASKLTLCGRPWSFCRALGVNCNMAADPVGETANDAELAKSLARLWPNREHEASAVAGLLCRAGVHYWRRLDLTDLAPGRDVRFCFWCSKIEIDGTVHTP